MANFAVSASDEVIAQGKELLEKLAQPGDKQGDVLERIFRIVNEQSDSATLKDGGVDVRALDSSLSAIRTMFLAAITGKEQIVAEKDRKIEEIKDLKEQMEKDLRGQLAEAEAEKEQEALTAEAAAKAAAQAVKDATTAKEQAETATNLAAEKDKTIATLADKLASAEGKAAGYDDLLKEKAAAQEQILELNRQMAKEKEDFEHALEKINAEMERKLSDAQKDAALELTKAMAEKDRELSASLRDADRENAKLQAKIEALEEQIRQYQK